MFCAKQILIFKVIAAWVKMIEQNFKEKLKTSTDFREKIKQADDVQSVDHIIELQLILQAIKNTNISAEGTIVNIGKYFNETWNLEILRLNENKKKGGIVKKFIEITQNQDKNLDQEEKEYIYYIRSHWYKKNRELEIDQQETFKLFGKQLSELLDKIKFLK